MSLFCCLAVVITEGDIWVYGVCSVAVAGITFLFLLANTDLFLITSAQASLDFLSDADLRTTTQVERSLKAVSLWESTGAVIMAVRRPGCSLCREEASALCSLKSELDELGVPLYAVVKENIGTEIRDFKPYFCGEIFVDEKQRFYGSEPRRMKALGIVRLGVWRNLLLTWKKGYRGNMKGEGFVLGGLFVIGPGKQGILLEHKEKEFGDKADLSSVLEAAKKIQKEK
ncbi:peroxiredoxin-like 2A [Chanos chanos]|uniref:Peroxiredoxin-like 2A n=1 Tax=Chanos chanos TaxID=29144 RepID=A0A6J2VG00_CHACN|nr:peroxiredoxin-like 2A [Chanos chanos]